MTALDDFFLVHHYDPAPVRSGDWSIDVTSTRGAKRTIRLDEVRTLPERSVVALIECAGMSRGYLPDAKPGTQFGHGLVATATWTGARLADVLAYCGIDSDFRTLIVRGSDAGIAQPEGEHSDFAKGLPREKVLDSDTLLAWGVNGEPVPWLHGGPLRLVVPGWFGVWWVKWPEALAAVQEEFAGFWQTRRYTYQAADARQLGPVTDLLPRSLILTPRDGEQVFRGELDVTGLAWAGAVELRKIEVTLDHGHTWVPADVTTRFGRWAWLRWKAKVQVPGPAGLRSLGARASDAAGRTQEWRSQDNRLGYANNGIHEIRLSVVV